MKKHLMFSVLMLLGLLAYSGCHTMEGAGKDIENGGEHLQDAAKDANH
ncbi:MAG TPA: entericidin A/B family lipoprotein [Opitutaceae bacterium]|nr:entericidin A/B family lipoprotein [Opitutaceae bacterium]